MIVIDSSALMAIVLDEPEADRCGQALLSEPDLVISAVTLSEALIVAGRRDRGAEMSELLDGLPLDIIPASEAIARRVAETYSRWGDCFSYVTARDRGCPLLYVGDDFARTDLVAA
jgi:ribonuclease VapC